MENGVRLKKDSKLDLPIDDGQDSESSNGVLEVDQRRDVQVRSVGGRKQSAQGEPEKAAQSVVKNRKAVAGHEASASKRRKRKLAEVRSSSDEEDLARDVRETVRKRTRARKGGK